MLHQNQQFTTFSFDKNCTSSILERSNYSSTHQMSLSLDKAKIVDFSEEIANLNKSTLQIENLNFSNEKIKVSRKKFRTDVQMS